MMQNLAEVRAPSLVSIVQRPSVSLKIADITRVLNWMSRRRSKRSATWLA
jgi:hypothetical protein